MGKQLLKVRTTLIAGGRWVRRAGWGCLAALISLGSAHSVHALEMAQAPLFMQNPVRPIAMLNMSNDHQLYFKLYDDYSDLTGDGLPNTTYTHSVDYYGYFDPYLCYDYLNNVFVPASRTADKYCNGNWSGNFLNWASMTRIDAVRKILYGGYRSTDTATRTVLERSYLPSDAHSFAKYYNGSDLNRLTPWSNSASDNPMEQGITFCNTTRAGSGMSQTRTQAPRLRVARGNYSLWATNERWQCRWASESTEQLSATAGSNGNIRYLTQAEDPFGHLYSAGDYPRWPSGIPAYIDNPPEAHRLGQYDVRVEVCVAGLEGQDENCEAYDDGSVKPTGLLQKYGETNNLHFGLITGSYGRNKSGGVLRTNVGSIADEINDDGTFVNAAGGIIASLNRLRIYGYNHGTGTYHQGDSGHDNCAWGLSSFSDGSCSNWGNPQSEIYLESLRYLAGLPRTEGFHADDSTRFPGLTTATWEAPINQDNWCAPTSVIQFNASTSSYDHDMSGATGLGLDARALTNAVGAAEGIHGGQYFVGGVGVTGDDQLCTAKTVSSLYDVSGTCPDAPRLEGTYRIAGLAYGARRDGIPIQGTEHTTQIKTYGVALAPAVPEARIPVPGGGSISILPACRNTEVGGNCAIVDFKFVDSPDLVSDASANRGRLYVNWEDSEQGGDFDFDMWGVIEYEVTATRVSITTQVVAQATNFPMGFGYVLGGTDNDGFHVHSGVNDFVYGDYCTATSPCVCADDVFFGFCDHASAAPSTREYGVASSTARLLETPLYYAAKWGGYDDDDMTVQEISAYDPHDSSYFFATDPRKLEEGLDNVFSRVAAGTGAAAATVANSTRLTSGSAIFQALFHSGRWSGELQAFAISGTGQLSSEPLWRASESLPFPTSGRNIYTVNTGGQRIPFVEMQIDNMPVPSGSGFNEDHIRWLRGQHVPGMRNRNVGSADGEQGNTNTVLGDIVNSTPAFRNNVVYVGANDGMLHAFNASNGQELFAYVPRGVYERLPALTRPDYGQFTNPHQYTVDGPVFAGRVHNRDVVVGTLGAGGKGLFALDVTNPSEPQVIFDWTRGQSAPDPTGNLAQIGNITGRPIIAPLKGNNDNNTRWALVFGNGYNSANQRASLVIVELEAQAGSVVPGTVRVLPAGTMTANGLAEPVLAVDADNKIKAAYAGDLRGNLWKFDLSRNNAGQWGAGNQPLFVALDPSGERQPITAAPTLGLHPFISHDDGGPATMVYFGTGRYLTEPDLSDEQVQSFYAILDEGTGPVARSNLFVKTITSENGGVRRVFQGNPPSAWWHDSDEGDVSANYHRGWLLDFATVPGERAVNKPALVFDRLLFPTIIPVDDPCSFGGSSWLMELVGVGEMFTDHSAFDSEQGMATENLATMSSMLVLENPGDGGVIVVQESDGSLNNVNTGFPLNVVGRQSWRQMQ